MKHNDNLFRENRSKVEELFEIISSGLSSAGDFYSAHLWSNHSCRITDDILRRRIISERKRCASAFNISNEQVAKKVSEIINLEKEYILDWLADDGDGDDFELMFTFKNENMGRMYLSDRTHEWEDGSITCDSICVILSKTGNRKLFNIKTAYPYSSNIPMPTSQEFGY